MTPKGRNNAKPVSRILVIDDEVDMLNNYCRMLRRSGHECAATSDPRQVETLLNEFRPHLVLTDLVMPGASGMEVLAQVREYDAKIPVVILTAHGSIENAVEAMKQHAADYLTKPFSIEELLGKIQILLSDKLLRDEPDGTGSVEGDEDWRNGIIGQSAALNRVLEISRKVARTDVNVLITGESGTGKEVFARTIHRLSGRRNEIFVPVDCSSLPENLLESELFGYRKGAFTGANADKMGLFEFAHKGTLFLDEIGEMPLSLQSKLLRVLQERRFRPLGGRNEIEIDVRVLAATNRDLEEAVREKTFRSDLYYRLNVFTLHLPLLRDRTEDIPLLAGYFLADFVRDNGLAVEMISREAMACLKRYDWPGNVRELQNVIEHAATMAAGAGVEVRDLPEHIRKDAQGEEDASSSPAQEPIFDRKNRMIGDFERDYLISLLVNHKLNVSRAAEAAGCHRRTLYRMIRRHRLDLASMRKQLSGKAS